MGAANEIRTVLAAYSAFGRGDLGGVLDALSERVTWDATDALWARGTYSGHAGVRRYFEGIEGLWDDLRLQDYDIEPAGEGRYCVQGRVRGRSRATGEVIDSPFTHWVEVGADGKIARLEIVVVHDDRRA